MSYVSLKRSTEEAIKDIYSYCDIHNEEDKETISYQVDKCLKELKILNAMLGDSY